MLNKALTMLTLIFLLNLSSSYAESTQAELVEKQAYQLYNTIMSPYCPAATLSACTSADAGKLRIEIMQWMLQGDSVEQVKSRLIEEYGVEILGVPENSGFGLVGWWMPFVVLIVGVLIITVFLRRMGKRLVNPKAQALDFKADAQQVDSEMQERIKRELKARLR